MMKTEKNREILSGTEGERVTACREHIRLSREAAKEGMVLLKNENHTLPLPPGTKVALFGKGTFDYVKGGGGSGDVTTAYVKNLYDGLTQLGDAVSVFEESADYYRRYVEEKYRKGALPGMMEEPELPAELVSRAAEFTDTAVISISRFSGEGWDRKSDYDRIGRHRGVDQKLVELEESLYSRSDYCLSDAEEAMVGKVLAAFPKVIVVMNVGGIVDSTWFKKEERISAVLMAWQAGMEGGTAAAELLTGVDSPCGKLADTFAASLNDYPSSETFYESDDYVDYFEDIYVGYRYFETIPGRREKVNYPFGFGLSYTTFGWSEPEVCLEGEEIRLSVRVRNTGAAAGREVLQLYGSAPQGKLGKPARVLLAFAGTKKLVPGEAQTVELTFARQDLASYDDLGKVKESAWVLEKGEYRFFLGTDVRSAEELSFRLQVEEDEILRQLTRRLAPAVLARRLRADGSWEELPAADPGQGEKPGMAGTVDPFLSPMTQAKMSFGLPGVRKGEKRRGREEEEILLRDVAEGRASLQDLIAQLSEEDLCWLVGGQPNTGVANTFGWGNNPEHGIPNVMTADGPAGLRIRPEEGVCTTAFSCACLLACTWDPELAEQVGRAGGREVKENGIGVWLTPAVNIHRTPLCGRNFEYYSEDPFLTGKMAAAMVRGIQSSRVAACVKHFALNNKETNRRESDSRCSERAVREIYLKAFEIIVREAAPWSLMSSYNRINSRRSSENRDLLTGILREEWGFDGVVTSDWWTFGEHYRELKAGNDIKMGCGYPKRLKAALAAGALDRADLETAAERILRLILRVTEPEDM